MVPPLDLDLATISKPVQMFPAGTMTISLDAQQDLALALVMLSQLVPAAQTTRSASNYHLMNSH